MASKKTRWLWLAIVPVAIVGVAAWQGLAWWERVTRPVATEDADPVRFEIEPGTPAAQIGIELAEAGIVRSPQAWRLQARWMRWQDEGGDFQAGTYDLSPDRPLEAIAQQIWNGEVAKQRFTVPEGWSIDRMGEHFETLNLFSAEAFIAATRNVPYDRFPWLPADLPHLEGFLFPDTYQFPDGELTPETVIDRMLSEFERVALPVYQEGENPLDLGLRDWVTLASIVEKESVVQPERPIIAGVFTQRLRQGMKLEADPTVEYGLGIEQTPENPLTFAQVETPSPYNTYLNPGLPPTPIASPGLASLEATIAPEDTDYLFFVARYDGTHIFSRTLAEHEAAIEQVRSQFID